MTYSSCPMTYHTVFTAPENDVPCRPSDLPPSFTAREHDLPQDPDDLPQSFDLTGAREYNLRDDHKREEELKANCNIYIYIYSTITPTIG